jgi:hypothetical protein
MQQVPEPMRPEVGAFDVTVYNAGRHGRHRSSHFKVRCDALGLDNDEILLLSVVGPETSVKALIAGLRSARQDQQRIDYAARVGGIERARLVACPEGYRVSRAKLPYGLWHVLCLACRDGFLPVLTEKSLWQQLRGEPFTTPLLREWTPWLYRTMKERGLLTELTQSGCQAGLLHADSEALDALVCEGIQKGHLAINGRVTRSVSRVEAAGAPEVESLDQYLLTYGPMLGRQAERALQPLHVPARDACPELDLLREPFEAQAHAVEAARKALGRQKALLLVGEMGTGKTLMAMAACHAHAAGRPYRALVFCPGQLVDKWAREIRTTLPDVEVIQIESWKSLLHLDPSKKPVRAQWYVLARDRAKLGSKWRPAVQRRRHADDGLLRCPHCGRRLVNEEREPLSFGRPVTDGHAGTGLWKKRSRCQWVLTNTRGASDPEREDGDRLVEGCGSPLWQMTRELWRYEPALFIKRHLRHFFTYLVLDEVHEEKGADTAQGHAAGALAACCRKVIALTGTLVGGYAEHLRPLLFRLAPHSLVQEGLGWSQATAFNERYGRIETRITERSGVPGEDNRMSRGSKTTIKSVRPGVMPVLFGRHLLDKTVFLQLSEVADNLPPLKEECWPIRMDATLAGAYQHTVEEPLVQAIKELMRRNDRRLLGTMLQALLAYPDLPFGWSPIGYHDKDAFVTVTTPWNLPQDVVRAKERAVMDLVRAEKAQGRKVWLYVQFTDRHDVESRVEKLLRQAGLRVGVLRSSVPLARREEWIAEHAPQLDVVISHPRLVETGLDLFDKVGRHNFPTLVFYETGYNLFTLRQASRRSWRIGQTEPCRVVYLYYESTMQDRAMALMGKKLTAAQALEGVFSGEGLAALAGEDANMEIALARSLVERLDEGDGHRAWNKVCSPCARRESVVPPPQEQPLLWLEPVELESPVRPGKSRRKPLSTAGVPEPTLDGWLF